MDPITATIVGALAAGALAAAKDVATASVKDAYGALKRVIADRYQKAGPFVDAVEADPTSKPEQEVLSKQLSQAGSDPAVKDAAVKLLEALEELKTDSRAGAVFDFEKLRALKGFKVRDAEFAETLLRAKEATFEGDFVAENLKQVRSKENLRKN